MNVLPALPGALALSPIPKELFSLTERLSLSLSRQTSLRCALHLRAYSHTNPQTTPAPTLGLTLVFILKLPLSRYHCGCARSSPVPRIAMCVSTSLSGPWVRVEVVEEVCLGMSMIIRMRMSMGMKL